MKLTAYPTVPAPLELAPASPFRDWMDAFPARHAYRCLPLAIANCHGWELLAPRGFSARWTGGPAAADVEVTLDGAPKEAAEFASSHFTHGILTILTGYIFKTEPGWNLYVTGPLNRVKDGLQPLSAVVETDWLPYTFTMNWLFTAIQKPVHFDKGEPLCAIFPIQRGVIQKVEPEVRDLEDDPELLRQYAAWRAARDGFMDGMRAGDPEVLRQAWQRYYFDGQRPDGGAAPAEHEGKLRARPFVDRRRPDRK